MNFTEAVNEIISMTKRPDKLADIRREVNAAIRFCCSDTDFMRDFEEISVTIDSSVYSQSLALSSFTRFRKFAYIKPPAVKYYIINRAPNKIFDGCCEDVNTYYIAGDSIVFKTSALHSTLLAGWFKYPPTLAGTDTFWLLDVQPYMVINRAAAKIFADIGDDKSSSREESYFRDAYLAARLDLKVGANP